MIATDFSRGRRILAPGLDFAVAKRVQNLRLAYESLLSRFAAAPSTVALAVDSTCSPNTNPLFLVRTQVYGNRHGQVVQRREGLRLHHAGRRWRRPFRAFLGHSDERFQDAEGRPEGELRSHPGTQGKAGLEHPGRLNFARPPETRAAVAARTRRTAGFLLTWRPESARIGLRPGPSTPLGLDCGVGPWPSFPRKRESSGVTKDTGSRPSRG